MWRRTAAAQKAKLPLFPVYVRERGLGAIKAREVVPSIKKLVPTKDRLPHRPPGDPLPPQYVIRPFEPNPHLEAVQHIENRGMYNEELCIERGRHPKWNRCLVIQTDGSLNELEFEFPVPPLMPLFRDRASALAEHRALVQKSGRVMRLPYWKNTTARPAPPLPSCNAVEFPFAVPTKAAHRPAEVIPTAPEYPAYVASIMDAAADPEGVAPAKP